MLPILILFNFIGIQNSQKCGQPNWRMPSNSQNATSTPSRSASRFGDNRYDFDGEFYHSNAEKTAERDHDERDAHLRLSDGDPDHKVVGGYAARPHSWPWMGALAFRGVFVCGASLIDAQFAVSAAHCFTKSLNPADYQLVFGAHDLRIRNFTVHRLARVRLHPLFNLLFPRAHDVALLKLSRPAILNERVNLVCLPSLANLPANSRCIVTGWGRLFEGGPHANVLQQLTVPIWENGKCNLPMYYSGLIHNSMLCAGFEQGRKDACQGDSGGPLVCYVEKQWQLHGIVSWGSGCAKATKPGVYTRVSTLASWITSEMRTNRP